MEVTFKALTHKTLSTYCTLGQKSYCQHYLHLWQGQDATAYIATSFTTKSVTAELTDSNCENYLIHYGNEKAGVLKITLNAPFSEFSGNQALYLHRLYLLTSFSGKGVGAATLKFVTERAKTLHKKVVWLEAMKNGRALKFYSKMGFQIAGETKITLPGVIEKEAAMWVLTKIL